MRLSPWITSCPELRRKSTRWYDLIIQAAVGSDVSSPHQLNRKNMGFREPFDLVQVADLHLSLIFLTGKGGGEKNHLSALLRLLLLQILEAHSSQLQQNTREFFFLFFKAVGVSPVT